MNVSTHLEKEDENTAKKRSRRREKSHVTDFKETVCFPVVVIRRVAQRKKDRMLGVSGVTGILGKAKSRFDPPHTGPGMHRHVEEAVD